MQNDKTPMKEKLLETVQELRNRDINFKEQPVLFRWSYPEEEDILFQLMISDINEMEKEEVTLQ